MIVKIAHIVLNVDYPQKQDEHLKSIGYTQSFSPGEIPNPENKQNLMYNWTELQHMTLYDKDKSVPIELINYGHTAPQPGRYELSNGEFSVTDYDLKNISENPPPEMGKFDNLNVKTSSINLSNQFWVDIGFELKSQKELSYNPPMNEFKLTIHLEEEASLGSNYLDSKGFSCLAFITTSIESDLADLRDAGYSTTKLKKVEFTDHSVRVAFITGPCGEIVELITILDC